MTERTCPRCAAPSAYRDRICAQCGDDLTAPSPATSEPRRWEPGQSVASSERSSTGAGAPPDQRLLVGIGAVIAIALVAIAGMMFLDRQKAEGRDAHGWGDLICRAKYGDPGEGLVWDRDIDGDNVCRPEAW